MFFDWIERSVFAVGLTLLCAATGFGGARTWTDSTGKFSVKAEFVEVEPDRVVLKKLDGNVIRVPLARLSDTDREYIKTRREPSTARSSSENADSPLRLPDAVIDPPHWNEGTPPFDVVEFLKAPPDKDNAAFLYLEAFLNLDPTLMNESIFPEMPEDERKAIWLASRPRREQQERMQEAWKNDPHSVSIAEIDSWLAHYDAGLRKLEAARQRRECVFQMGRSLHSVVPHTMAVSQVCEVIRWRMRRDLREGNLQRPTADVKTLLHLVSDLRPKGDSTVQRSSTRLEKEVLQELLPEILLTPQANITECDRLLTLLVEHEQGAIDVLREAIRGDYLVARQTLHDLQHRVGAFSPKEMKDGWQLEGDVQSWLACMRVFAEFGGGDFEEFRTSEAVSRIESHLLPTAGTGGHLLSSEDYATDVDILNHYHATLLNWARQPDLRRKLQEHRRPIELYPSLENGFLTRIVVWFLSAPFDSSAESKTLVRGSECLVALRRWQLNHAGVPPDLETVVKAAGMSDVPVDPFCEEPIRMMLIENEPIIYSVGPNGEDNLATRRHEFSPGRTWSDDDILFVLHDDFLMHRDTCAEIEKRGGRCFVDEYRIGKPITSVTFSGAQSTDSTLELITPLRQLTSLSLALAQVTDEGMKEVANLKRLESLDLSRTQVTDAGLSQLKKLPELKRLILSNTRVTNAGMKTVAGLSKLEVLYLGGTQVGDAGLQQLIRLPRLETLLLPDTQVTDAGMKDLVTLKDLSRLSLANTQVTDKGVKRLAELSNLKHLMLNGSDVTPAAIQELRKALPNARIVNP